ncbi:hypothetical protein TSUD_382980 [Trifolium subterraneum]|uniref:TOD1/MUCI70 glycosyltransferase-like domain-containing protein n=2 Tax=Trifolium TaxID=3898 RepID=A0A2Z6P6J1_TRISU|nr:hypothetical protein TSUD_382980 [Trifolium subterraneum]
MNFRGYAGVLRYKQGNADTFGGNLSTITRFSYFNHRNDKIDVPCGFLKEFPISNSDQIAMEKCDNVVVVSAIFNDHDKIRQPKGLGSKTLENVCFFMFVDEVTLKDMAISKHPFYVHTMEEAMATARWKKWWDVNGLKVQMETYCENGMEPWSPRKQPYASDVPDSALILRRHGVRNNLFSCLMFNELEAFNPRDQLPFAFVRDHMNPKLKLNMFEVEVFEQVAVEYRHNLKSSDGTSLKKMSSSRRTKRAEPDLYVNNGSCCGGCHKYLSTMWGEIQ